MRNPIMMQRKAHGSVQRVGSTGASVVLHQEGGVEARKLPSSQYKGVVPQPNGHWGAQIYEKNQRVWLGTFNNEAEAACAYDVAAQRFRVRDAITNFKPLVETNESDGDEDAELEFMRSHSKAEIVDMLRKHTYYDELQHSRRCFCRNKTSLSSSACGGAQKEHLFDKVMSPSDVGKLNRLVIPKQQAEKNFPLQQSGGAATDAFRGVLLNFEDCSGKIWRFRYSYWNSSQSYVLTKGWSRFVKEKDLKAGDILIFRRSMGADKRLFIDWNRRAAGGCTTTVHPQSIMTARQPVAEVVVRLFGVNIVKVPTA